MREILFRGKLASGAWLYGDLRQYPSGVKAIRSDEWGHTLEVIPDTVGQYTGLKDKNGEKIFEGDVVQIWVDYDDGEPVKKYRAVVEFGNPNCEYNWGWQLHMIDSMPYGNDILLWVEMEDSGAYCEVIGNIHNERWWKQHAAD